MHQSEPSLRCISPGSMPGVHAPYARQSCDQVAGRRGHHPPNPPNDSRTPLPTTRAATPDTSDDQAPAPQTPAVKPGIVRVAREVSEGGHTRHPVTLDREAVRGPIPDAIPPCGRRSPELAPQMGCRPSRVTSLSFPLDIHRHRFTAVHPRCPSPTPSAYPVGPRPPRAYEMDPVDEPRGDEINGK